MEWSDAARSVWGKLDPEAGTWMPLVRHLEDASAVAGYLWDEFLPEATRHRICDALAIPGEQGQQLVRWLASIHDIGKISPAFAAKAAAAMPSVLGIMRGNGLDARPTPEDRLAPHATVGQVVLERWLGQRYPDTAKRVRTTYACIVGCHHGATPGDDALLQVENRPAQLGRGRWDDVRTEVLDEMARRTGAEQHLTHWLGRPLPVTIQILLSGIVIMADWIASDTDLFPYSGGGSTQRLHTAIRRLALPEPWLPAFVEGDVDALLAARFPALKGRKARPLQASLVAAARQVPEPTLFIVEGPMGVGKTEAALLAAEILAARFGMGGVFVGLPTMATANPMFDRVERWLRAALNGRRASLALAHGKAALNDNYATLLQQAWNGQLFDEEGDGGSSHASVVVNQWLRGRKRAGLADFVVGTIDQSLFAALKAKHFVLRHLGLVGKVVIIDEVHAADDYMREYLKRLLSWLGAYRTPVILMSATLPPSQRAEFRNAYAENLDGERRESPETDEYPRISVGNAGDEIHVTGEARQVEVEIRQLADDPAALMALVSESLADGGCAAVICNTVRRAQDTFASLVEVFGDDVQLVHSRFIAPERARREAELVQALGPDGSLRPHRLIVVGTQVIEQSLDVDFDLMVSDLAPVDLLLQRAGRLHRHDRPDRPPSLRQPVLWLRGVEDWSAEPPRAVRGSTAVYGTQRLLAAAAILRGVQSVRFPDDIPRLVRVAYDAPQIPVGWEAAWADAQQTETTRRLMSVARAQTYLLGTPWESGSLNGLIDVVSGDPDRLEEQGKSQVRDGEEGLEVMALWRGDDRYLRLPDRAPRFPGRVIPEVLQWGTADDERLSREMAACTLRLPAAMCHPGVIEGVIRDLERFADYSGWQRSHWIAGQLALVFDSSGECHAGGFGLSYDAEQGLQYARLEESHQR